MNIQVLSAPGCPACAKVKAKLDALGASYEIIDITEHPEFLKKYPIMTAPGVVIDGKLAFTGDISEQELKNILLS